jgi:hypothetical protein
MAEQRYLSPASRLGRCDQLLPVQAGVFRRREVFESCPDRAHRFEPMSSSKACGRPDAYAQLTGFSTPNEASVLNLAEPIKNFDALPGRPEHFGIRLAVKQRDGDPVMAVLPALVSQPPGRIGVHPHFFSDFRKATPSNFAALALPTARLSASFRVMRGRALWSRQTLVCPWW